MRHGVLNSTIALLIVLSLPAHVLAEAAGESALLSKVRQLTFEGKRAGEGYFSADGSRMIFQSERSLDNPFYQIFLLDLETGDLRPVSPGVGKTTCAWIHPDGERVLYASTHEDPEARQKMRAELDFRASGQSRRYSWDYDDQFDIYQQELNTGQSLNLTATLGYDAEGAYSPDGKTIVFASNRHAYSNPLSDDEKARFAHDKSFFMDLYLMDADGANVRRLTRAPGYDGGPFFSADGRHITWRRFSLDGSIAEIYTMDLASGQEKQVTRMGMMSWAPYFHPSGDYLIFASNSEGFANFELFIVDAAGTREPVRVTHTDGFDGLPVFAPDGETLSWTSNRTQGGMSQIFLAAWDDAAARKLLHLDAERSEQDPAPTFDDSLQNTQAAIRVEDLRLHVERLTSDRMQGRLTGTEGELHATAYVARAFEQLGLEPAGDAGDWYQAFSFDAGASPGAGNQLEVSGLNGPVGLETDRDWRPLALSRSGTAAAAEVVFAGYGIVAPGSDKVPDYDSYGDLDVQGKWVMVLRYQPESVSPAWRRHLLHYSDLGYKASVAKRLGALGLIVVTGPRAAAPERLVELKTEAAAVPGSLFGLSISDDLAARMLESSGQKLEMLQQGLDEGGETRGFELPGVRVAATVDIQRERRVGRNVVARLKAGLGAGPPVILGAHVDHLGRGETSSSLARNEERGRIHPGADDNASGVAALLESAQYLVDLNARKKLAPVRDILFVAWSGEELGTLGSSHFVQQLSGPGDLRGKVSAYLNMDMVGHLREKLYLQGTGSSSAWSREIERRNAPLGLAIATKSDPYLPTDVTPFYLQGVPVLNAFTGAHEDYSTPRDTADSLNYQGIRDIARLMAGITRSLARSPGTPDYLEVVRTESGVARKHLRAYLGTIPAYGQDEGARGVKLQGAIKGAPADKAGVKSGDVLVALAGVEIENIHDFMSALAGLRAGEPAEMTILREGRRIVLDVIPAARE